MTVVGALTIGCGAARTAGTPETSQPSSSPSPSTQSSSTLPPSSSPGTGTNISFDTSADAVVLAVARTQATVAGVQGGSTTTVYGDGRIVRTRGDGVRSEQLRIAPESLRDLMNQVASLRGGADPGSPVSDVGWTVVTFTVEGQQTRIRLGDVPSGSMNDQDTSPEGKARAAVGVVLKRLGSLQDLTVVEEPKTLPLKSIALFAGVEDSGDIDWPFTEPPSTVFEAGRCAVVKGADAEKIADLLVAASANRNGPPIVVVRTGDPLVPALEIKQAQQCLAGDPPREARPLPQPWPATDRRWSTGYEGLAINRVLQEASGHSDPQLHDINIRDLEWWNTTATVNGKKVYDVQGVPRDRATLGSTLNLRIDASTGKILKSGGGR